MRTDRTPYAERATGPVAVSGAVDVTRPTEGFYRHKLRSGGVYGGVRIWYGAPLDPVTGEELDRSWRWQAAFNGRLVDDFEQVWPVCAGDPITAEEYRTYCNRQRWAEQHAPQSAYADPRKRVDPLSTANPLAF
jgi:hypothetical protein